MGSKGFLSVVYLGDFLMISDNREDCYNNIKNTKNLLESLGLVINYKKSQLNPSHQCEFLGFVLDSQDYSIYLTNEKREKINKMIFKLSNEIKPSISATACVIGTLVAACPAVDYGWLYTKRLERGKFLALVNSNGDFDQRMDLNKEMRSDVKWWQENIKTAKKPIRDDRYCLEIFTDASLTGWGGFCAGEKVHGWWESSNSDHINLLELKAAFYGLKCFA